MGFSVFSQAEMKVQWRTEVASVSGGENAVLIRGGDSTELLNMIKLRACLETFGHFPPPSELMRGLGVHLNE